MTPEQELEYQTIFESLQTRESSTLTLISLFMSASFVIMGIIATNFTQQIPNWLLWMGLLLVLISIVYRLVTSDFDNHCYAHLRELEKVNGAINWLDIERKKKGYSFFRRRGHLINLFLTALTAQWIIWLLNWSETWILFIGVVAFSVIFFIDFCINDP